MQQAQDFREESRALAALIEPLTDADFQRATLFKQWTINDVLGHLHMFNVAAHATLESPEHFQAFFAPIAEQLQQGRTLLQSQGPWLNGLAGRALFEAWQQAAEQLADAYANADPKQRVRWAGPDMSALSSITARQMETWAHGQAVFDLLGVERTEHDRVRNIAHLGVGTFGWTFINRKEPVPEPAPHVRLTSPSGAVWIWNPEQADNLVEGDAVAFAQVVTQVRHVADTRLQTRGETARRWMAMAQCFAGPPQDPPAPGTRYKAAK